MKSLTVKLVTATAIVSTFATLGACNRLGLRRDTERAQATKPAAAPVTLEAPKVTVPALDGTPVDLATMIGRKPVLIEFWATWCGSCKAMLPRLRAAHARWGKDVEFIGVNVTISEDRDSVAAWVARESPPFRTLWDGEGEAARAYDAQATSFIVILDRRGRVAYTGSGGTQNLEPVLRQVAAQ